MKIIIDQRLTDRLESVRLKPKRFYFCAVCNTNYQRQSVKKVQGTYSCIHCGKPVVDITNTDAGQQLITMLGM
jgi:predicted SprT family Zn-dependent metalloprotease